MAVITIPGMFLTGDHASRPAANTVGSGSIYSCSTHALIYQSDGSSWTTWATLGASGTITGSGLTMATDRLLGRDTASTGAIEELTIGSGLSLSGGTLSASGGSAGNLESNRVVKSGGDFTTSATTFTDVTGFSITFTTGARRCLVGLVGSVQCNNVAGGIGLDVDIDGSRQGGTTAGLTFIATKVANEPENASFTYMTDILSAASHTFKLQMIGSNASHTNTLRGSDPYSVFWVTELYAD